jgi:hypothetical protein
LSVYAFVIKMVEIIQNESLNRKPFLLNPVPSKEYKEKAAKIKNKKILSASVVDYLNMLVVRWFTIMMKKKKAVLVHIILNGCFVSILLLFKDYLKRKRIEKR